MTSRSTQVRRGDVRVLLTLPRSWRNLNLKAECDSREKRQSVGSPRMDAPIVSVFFPTSITTLQPSCVLRIVDRREMVAVLTVRASINRVTREIHTWF
jgi:hypothetical protein